MENPFTSAYPYIDIHIFVVRKKLLRDQIADYSASVKEIRLLQMRDNSIVCTAVPYSRFQMLLLFCIEFSNLDQILYPASRAH